MNIVIGLDHGAASDVLDLVKRLRFRQAMYHLTHAIPTTTDVPCFSYSGYAVGAALAFADAEGILEQEEADAEALLRFGAETVSEEEGKHTTCIRRGVSAEVLMTHADDIHADLIAINAPHRGTIRALMSGGVARDLVIGARQSVLLARRGTAVDTTRPLRVVLATDHSPYMDRCMDRFIRTMPQGIEHLTVLTAFPEGYLGDRKAYLPHLAVSPADAMRRELENRNSALVRRIVHAKPSSEMTVTSRVSGESVDCAIEHVMQETGADLLIVGAQGHTFMERLTLGSVSFRQAMTSPYSVMVLRLDPVESTFVRASREAEKTPTLDA